MSDMVAVTGAAGKTGRAVTAALSRRGVPVRALVHSKAQAAQGVPGARESIAVDLADSGQVKTALQGADAVYLIAPNMYPAEPELAEIVIETCCAGGPTRLVYHSVIHPYAPAMPHHVDKADAEALVAQSGVQWSIVQPASYFENALGAWESITTDGLWPLPYSADAPFTPVALADVADAAAHLLTESGHRFATYELAGPEVLTTAEMAEAAGDVLGHHVAVRVNRAGAEERPARLQAMFNYYDNYGICGNSTVLGTLLGRAPMNWRRWVTHHK